MSVELLKMILKSPLALVAALVLLAAAAAAGAVAARRSRPAHSG